MDASFGRNRSICRYNLRGMCRFGTRCWNRHEIPETVNQREEPVEVQPKVEEEEGACALSPDIDDVERLSDGPSASNSDEGLNGDKTCSICYDTVMKKENKQGQAFGLLPNCNHCFCFDCIVRWRQSKDFGYNVSKACPECRVASDYVYRSSIWIESTEKNTFIESQKQKMKLQHCRYFRQGQRRCPFGNLCLYLHATPDGKLQDVGPPSNNDRRNNALYLPPENVLQQFLFWINDEHDELDLDTDDDEDDDIELDLSDPCLAVQYYDKDDYRYYIAMDRLLNAYNTESEDDFDVY